MKKDEGKKIRIRMDINENEPVFEKFNTIKQKTGLNANSEVIRYVITKAFDLECTNEGIINS
ncbi:MAG: hypothetical protein ACFFDF_08090 [Candidatus Odinarchaeota archaeon]